MYVDMLFVNLNKTFKLKLQDQQPRSYRDGQSSSVIFTPKTIPRHGNEFVVHIVSPLINALLEST